MRIAIVGAGAMGSVYAGLLGRAGNEVWAVDPWLEHVEAIRERGLRVEGASGDRLVRVHATSDPSDVGTVDLVVIATKAMDVRGAAESAGALLGRETVVLPIQNGLGSADAVADVLGADRVVLGVAEGFGASVVAPGHVHHHGRGLVRLGERSGPVTPRVEQIADVWRGAGLAVRTYDDVDRLVWEKLVCNVAFSGPCTLLGATIGQVLDDPLCLVGVLRVRTGGLRRRRRPRAWRSPTPTRSPTSGGSAKGYAAHGRRCCSTGWRAGRARST